MLVAPPKPRESLVGPGPGSRGLPSDARVQMLPRAPGGSLETGKGVGPPSKKDANLNFKREQ